MMNTGWLVINDNIMHGIVSISLSGNQWASNEWERSAKWGDPGQVVVLWSDQVGGLDGFRMNWWMDQPLYYCSPIRHDVWVDSDWINRWMDFGQVLLPGTKHVRYLDGLGEMVGSSGQSDAHQWAHLAAICLPFSSVPLLHLNFLLTAGASATQ